MRLSIGAFILIVIPLFSTALYLNATCGNFICDDFKIVAENSFIREWRYLPKIFTKDYFSLSGEMGYRPLVIVSYFIDYAIWQTNPFGFHTTNVVLHIINTVLFYRLLRAILSNNKIIFLSILFFVSHPVLVETVNAIGYREDLLSATFLLVSFIYFIKSDSLFYGEHRQIFRCVIYYAVSLISYLCALFSKETAITLPILLMLFTVFFHQKPWPSLTRRLKGIYTGFLAISLFYLIIRYMMFGNPAFQSGYQPGSFWVNASTMIKILASYIKLSFFPLHLNADYVVPRVTHPWEASWILAVTFVCSIFIIFAILCRTRNMFALWMSWFFVTLLPVMIINPIDNIMAERYLYIPAMGFCVAKGILIYRITDRTLSPRAIPTRQIVQRTLVILMIGGYGFTIIRKNGNWRDELTLWTKTIADSPNSYRAHNNLGNIYFNQGSLDKARIEYEEALRIKPDYALAHNGLGNIGNSAGDPGKAIEEFRKAIELDANQLQGHYNLGRAYEKLGKHHEAIDEYNIVIRLDPHNLDTYYALGSLYQGADLTDKAIEVYQKTIFLNPDMIHGYKNLVFIYLNNKNDKEAARHYLKKLLKIDPAQAQKEDIQQALDQLR